MSDQRFDIETVVLSREYLETVHGRMTFSDAQDGEEAAVLLAESADGDSREDSAIEPLAG